jgi:hypothetical protein
MATITNLTSREEVEKQLMRDARVQILDAEPAEGNESDLSHTSVEVQIQKAESEIIVRLSRFYDVPLSMSNHNTVTMLNAMATNLAAYKCYLIFQPGMTKDNLPAAVLEWKKDVDAMLERIVPTGKSAPVAGRDIVLEGESLIAGAGTPGTAAIALTQFIPFGGTS